MKKMMALTIVAVAVGIAKAWQVETRVIALEKQVDKVISLSLATSRAVQLDLEIQKLKEQQETQMQVEVYEEPEPEPMRWMQL